MTVDLHIHSTVSDGTLTPQEIVQVAQEKGLTVIALADHDVVAGIDPAIKAAAGSELVVLPAVEMSTECHQTEVHILGYAMDIQAPSLLAKLARIRDGRRQRAEEIVEKLSKIGLRVTMAQVVTEAGEGSIGRPHVAAVLLHQGHVKDIQEAFARYLRPGCSAYVPRYRLTPAEAIREINAAGGVAVLAHLGLGNAEMWLDELVGEGLGGLEAYHVRHSPQRTRQFLGIAEQLDLLVTGGTDSHGPGGPVPVEMGSVPVPDECAQRLREWAEQRDSSAAGPAASQRQAGEKR